MNFFKKLYVRSFQGIMYVATFFLDFGEPERIAGDNALERLAERLHQKGITKVLVVTDPGLWKLGMVTGIVAALEKKDMTGRVYYDTVANPTIDNIEAALKVYHEVGCQAIVAVGGGSPMDCAKGVGARVARPHKTIPQMRGLLKVGKKLPLLVAIPTTAGTGSETTLAAVVTDAKTHEKYALNDPHLIPAIAVLDPTLTLKLPKHITSTTGMDALTHAVEAYIGHANTRITQKKAIHAVKLINDNLFEAYEHPENLKAREAMQIAAYDAGVAFTRAYVGYVHAVAHTLGGMYGVPHGLANAVILPYVLEAFGKKAEKKLAKLADVIGLGSFKDSPEVKSKAFIAWIREMNAKMAIPEKFVGVIKKEDIPLLAKRAQKEGVPLYPVPRLFDLSDFIKIYEVIQ